MSNALVTPLISIKKSVFMELTTGFYSSDDSSIKDGDRKIYLDIYMASALGVLQTKLFQLSKGGSDNTSLCLPPMGNYRLGFLGYKDFDKEEAKVYLCQIKITQTPCSFVDVEALSEWRFCSNRLLKC